MYNVPIPPIKITIGSSTVDLKNDSDAYAYLNAVANNSPSTERWRKGYQFDEKVPASEWNWTFGQMTRLLFRMRYDLYSATQELMHFIKDKIPDANFDDTDDVDMTPETQDITNHNLLDAVNTAIYTDRLVIAGKQTDNPAEYKSHLGSVATSNASGKVAVDPNTGVMTVNGMGDVAGVGSIVNPNALTSLTAILANIMNVIYPVGCYYWSSVPTDPSLLFGGTWVRVSGCFLWAAEDGVLGYTAGSTGGAKTHSLTAAQLPAHYHGLGAISGSASFRFRLVSKYGNGNTLVRDAYGTMASKSNSGTGVRYTNDFTESSGGDDTATVTVNNNTLPQRSDGGYISQAGGSAISGTAHNNMPPYLAAYCWRRTA